MKENTKLKILTDLIDIPTVNQNEVAVANYLQRLFQAHGLTATVDEFAPGRANLVLELGTGDHVLGITGHMDTVAVGDETAWHYPPFAATVDGDRIYGRGAADMKSGLAAQAIALIELYEAGKISGHLRFLATAGEEFGTPGANRLLKQGTANDLDALLVGEATGGDVVYAHAGSINYRLTSIGKAAHSSTPEAGVNALTPLVKFYQEEARLFQDLPQDPILGTVKHSVTVIKGGDQVNSIPAQAELMGNVRPTKVVPNSQVIDRLQQLVTQLKNDFPGNNLELTIIHDFYPVGTAPQDEFIQTVLKASQHCFGKLDKRLLPKVRTINGATDASVFTKAKPSLPVAVLGPDAWESSHQVDEWTTISSYLATIEAYKQIISAW
ncbi:ArgE/DapE family deacylase [Lactobacillus sp. 3B(2020)]|uniref:ArgE/DapE family deacylase n=1 Tax=Lactobacillus sp. 3B(2020) TaxID=2695882 RepID=UPI0015DE093B|nr:ArgE/DapE family deacylase [Lactobacillus sp. 3B(2020)]QLL69209.1 ArgE/DapE family deacylase [Lactobacillus sp. 3B(2020)]